MATMKSVLGSLLCAILALLLVSCVPWPWEYLDTAADRATQEDVARQLGAPSQTRSVDENGWVWTYRYTAPSSLVGRRGDMLGGFPCVEYVLTFDEQKILRHWVRQPC